MNNSQRMNKRYEETTGFLVLLKESSIKEFL